MSEVERETLERLQRHNEAEEKRRAEKARVDRLIGSTEAQIRAQVKLLYGEGSPTTRELMDRIKGQIETTGMTPAEAFAMIAKAHGVQSVRAHRVRVPPRGMTVPSFAMGGKLQPAPPTRRERDVPDPPKLGESDPTCSPETPPPAPSMPHFVRVLSGEGMARFLHRALSADPRLRRHCDEVREDWTEESTRLRRTMEETRWPFPSFTPRARPFDWGFDGGLGD